MNCATGDILSHGDVEQLKRDGEIETMNKLVSIEEEELPKLRRMNKPARKNWMRNKPCPCNSGKKFKKCCWSLYASGQLKQEDSNGRKKEKAGTGKNRQGTTPG